MTVPPNPTERASGAGAASSGSRGDGERGAAGAAGTPATGAKVWIDGRTFEVEPGRNLLHACLSLGLDLPYFCWHPALGSVGACRQCAVKQYRDENDTRGRLVMACMTGADDGVRISIDDREAKEFRTEVIEWLMTNHPHDCPVCDEGGECHLQDMTVMTGHAARRYRFPKRTFRNQYLGPFLNHEMNRCITCYRCVRFYKDYAGGRDLEAQAAHNWVYFGRHQDGVLENEWSGNLAEVCPTGVFTDKTSQRHYVRKWDLTHAPSVCVHCAVGCNVIAGERGGQLRRILNRYHSQVNDYFLCDRGRFGYEFVNREQRVREPLLRSAGGELAPAAAAAALDRFAELLVGGGILGIASPRASLESCYALERLVGPAAFHRGIAAPEAALLERAARILASGPAASASLEDARQSDAVLVLGEDPTMTAPVLALALRQAARVAPVAAVPPEIPRWHDAAMREHVGAAHGPFFVVSPLSTRLDDVATCSVRADCADVARIGHAVARALRGGDGALGAAGGSRSERSGGATDSGSVSDLDRLAREIAAALAAARRPLVVAGTASGEAGVLDAAAEVAAALGARAHIALIAPECNSLGVTLLGGAALESAFAAIDRGEVETLVVLENDLYRRAPRARVDQALARVPHLVVLDHWLSPTAARAQLVLPAATFAEGDGTLVSAEGRAQRFFQVIPPRPPILESWRWLGEGAARAGLPAAGPWVDVAQVSGALARQHPALARAGELAAAEVEAPGARPLPRQPHRWSGRTAVIADRTVHEPAPPRDPDSPFVFSMEGAPLYQAPGRLLPFYWWPRWNSVQSLNKFQDEVGGPLRGGEPGVRLLEPGDAALLPPETAPPGGGTPPAAGAWRVIAAPQIFGSEELSAAAPAIAERTPQPFVAIGDEDAAALGAASGDVLEVAIDGESLRLAVRLDAALPAGTIALPAGLPGLPYLALPARGEVRKP